MRLASLTLIFWIAGSSLGWCQSNVMQFEAFPPDTLADKLMGNHAWSITYAELIARSVGIFNHHSILHVGATLLKPPWPVRLRG